MKVLFVTHHYLDDNSGGSFASRAYVNAFSEIADSCMLMYPYRGIAIRNFIHPNCILKAVPYNVRKIQKLVDVYRGRLHRYTDVMLPQILEFKPDIVVFDNSRTTAGVLKQVKQLGTKTICIHHNYEMEYYRGTKPPLAWRFPFLYYMEKAEKTAIQQADLNLTLTDEDVNLLQTHYDSDKTKKIEKLGSFEPATSLNLTEDENKTKTTGLNFAITGTLDSYQTEISVIPFLENEYPELLKKLPESKLLIAGRNPSSKMIEVCAKHSSINLIANPENMQDVIAQADVYICPTCVGGGLKLRVMDGLKGGLPVLTHTVSARGYNDFEEANCLFSYNDTAGFAAGLNKLLVALNSGNLNKKNIKDLYFSIFSFEAGVNRLKNILNEHKLLG